MIHVLINYSNKICFFRSDKEYQLCLQRLPKELAVLLQSWDYSPSAKACHCRKEFGLY